MKPHELLLAQQAELVAGLHAAVRGVVEHPTALGTTGRLAAVNHPASPRAAGAGTGSTSQGAVTAAWAPSLQGISLSPWRW